MLHGTVHSLLQVYTDSLEEKKIKSCNYDAFNSPAEESEAKSTQNKKPLIRKDEKDYISKFPEDTLKKKTKDFTVKKHKEKQNYTKSQQRCYFQRINEF